MKNKSIFLSLIMLLGAHASYTWPQFLNRKVAGRIAAGSVATLTAYTYRNNLTKSCAPKAEQQFEIKTFDAKNKKHYLQVLKLLTEDKEFLLDLNEDPAETMQMYVQGIKTIPVRDIKDPYAGLIMKVMLTNNGDVAGFSTFVPDQYKMNLRTIAVDPKYRNKGIATKLLQDLEIETKKKNLPMIILMVYSHNDEMLKLIKQRGYKLYAQERQPAFSKLCLNSGKRIDVYTKVYVKEL